MQQRQKSSWWMVGSAHLHFERQDFIHLIYWRSTWTSVGGVSKQRAQTSRHLSFLFSASHRTSEMGEKGEKLSEVLWYWGKYKDWQGAFVPGEPQHSSISPLDLLSVVIFRIWIHFLTASAKFSPPQTLHNSFFSEQFITMMENSQTLPIFWLCIGKKLLIFDANLSAGDQTQFSAKWKAGPAEEMHRIWCEIVIIFNNLLNCMITIPNNKPECSIHYFLDAKYDVCWPFPIKLLKIPRVKSSKLPSSAFRDSKIKKKCQLSPKQGRFYCPSNQAMRVGFSMKLGTKISIFFSIIGLTGGKFMEDWFLCETEIKMWGGKSHQSRILACKGRILRALVVQINTGLLLS